jgi:hypothetical protein
VGEYVDRRKAPAHLRFTEWEPDSGAFIKKPYVTPEQMAERHALVVTPKSRAADKPPRIADQLAEEGGQVERGAETPAPGKKSQIQ